MEVAGELEQRSIQASAYKEMSELYAQQGDFEQGFRCQKLWHDLEREVSNLRTELRNKE